MTEQATPIELLEQKYRDYRATMRARIEAQDARIASLEAAVMDVGSSLTAAVSILRRADEGDGNVRKVVASNTMFRMMLKDYEASLKRARQALGADDAA